MSDYYQKVKKIINHPKNEPCHLLAIENCIDLYLEKTGDESGYLTLLSRKDNLLLSVFRKGKKIIINDKSRNHISNSS